MFYNGYMALKGVNLGGWLVAENWMTPSLFKGTSARNEYQLVRTTDGLRRLRQHHAEFITEKDIRWLADQKIELLRVPVGHWIFGDTPPYIGAIDRLDWIVRTAKAYGMQVLIDLHAAPGAQNARDHSGSGNQPHSSAWLKNKPAKQQTIDILCKLAARYKEESHIWGIEMLNEPACDPTGLRLAWFYRRAYRHLTAAARPGTRIVFSDAFRPWLLSGTFLGMVKKDFPVVMDCHLYQAFGKRNARRSFDTHLAIARRRRQFLRLLSLTQPVMVGEWSGALQMRPTKEQTRQFIHVQRESYSVAVAECFWSYKTEHGGGWDMRRSDSSGVVQ